MLGSKRRVVCNSRISESAYKISVKIFLRPLRQFNSVKIIVLWDFALQRHRIIVFNRGVCRRTDINVCIEHALSRNYHRKHRSYRSERKLSEHSERHRDNIQRRKSAENDDQQTERLSASPQSRNI